jgi:GT2 family glycosyltransferase
MEPRVSILVPSSHQADHLRACLAALAADATSVSREIILILNSPSAEVRRVASETAGVTVVESAVNLGVAGGFNRGRSLARGEYLTLIHDDTEVLPGWLDWLVETLDSQPAAGATGGLVLNARGGLANAGSVMWSDGWARNLWWGGAPPEPAQFAQLDAVHTTGSSFSLVRAAVFDAADGLDEGLHPGYFVDVTLGMAIRRQGRAVLLDPRARAVHHKSSSTSAAYREFLVRRNHARFCARWGDDLRDHHEPFVDNPESYRAAHERARTQAARAKREQRWEVSPPPRRLRVDPLAQERSLLETEHRVYRAWIDELEDRLAVAAGHQAELAKELQAAPASSNAETAARSAVHEELKKVLGNLEANRFESAEREQALIAALAERSADAAELAQLRRFAATRWAKLYGRLLPLLRVLSGWLPRRRRGA